MLPSIPIDVSGGAILMPKGHTDPEEARMEIFGPIFQPGNPAWKEIEDWWLVHKRGANTPNWDITVGCKIEGRPGLVLVEAKANWQELNKGGKPLADNASENSRANHARIKSAISQACDGWRVVDPSVSISCDSHYQLANRLSFAWKLATLGVPVVLMYLGFTRDMGIIDAGAPFRDDADWQRAFNRHIQGVFPHQLLETRLDFDGTPVWVVSRSRDVLESSPPRNAPA